LPDFTRSNNNPEEINKLFRAIHTVKGSAAQVGLKRLGGIAHRVEDLIGRLRDGEIEPSPAVVDLCLEAVDVLKKTLHRQWADEAEMRTGIDSLLGRIAEFAPMDADEAETPAEAGVAAEEQRMSDADILANATTPAKKAPKQAASVASTAKSVRIALARLDRMMNTVGELVIKPHAHGWPRGGAGEAGRYTKFLEGTAPGQVESFRRSTNSPYQQQPCQSGAMGSQRRRRKC